MLSSKSRIAVLGLLLHGAAIAAEAPPVKKPVAEIIPDTVAAFRGQDTVYREGWFIVPSGEKAVAYFKEHTVVSAGRAINQTETDVARHSAEYKVDLAGAGKSGLNAGKQVFAAGTALTAGEGELTRKAVQAEVDYGSEAWKRASQHFILGYMTFAERTDEDWKALRAIKGDYLARLKSDFSNLDELTTDTEAKVSNHIEGDWNRAWGEGVAAWHDSYERSGERSNSLAGLADILAGYVKFGYYALAKPTARSSFQGAEATAEVAGNVTKTVAKDVIFLPTAKVFMLSGEFVRSTGLALYYTTSLGIKLVAPSAEGGALAGLSLLSYGAAGATFLAGGAAGAVNQIGVTAATPVAAAGTTAVAGAASTTLYAARVTYDLLKGTTQVALNGTRAAIVLAPAIATQVPAQVGLTGADSLYFLFHDAKGLGIAIYKGEVQWHDDAGTKASVPARDLPVGTVVNLDALDQENDGRVEVISRDPNVIQNVLQRLPQDLRAGGRP